MKLTGQDAWNFIRECIQNKKESRLQDFEYSVDYFRDWSKAIKLNWAILRDYDMRGKRLCKDTELPIEICLTMPPHNVKKDSWCPPWFLWNTDELFAKHLIIEPILQYQI